MLSPSTLPADELQGRVIRPDDPDYDEARTVFYGDVDRRPSAIVKVAGADDVARVIAHAREAGLEFAVRSGGHSVAGHGVTEGGIVIDLSDMKKLEIDQERRTAWAETGLTAGEYTAAAAKSGLATGFGDTGSVGIGGITPHAGGVGVLRGRGGGGAGGAVDDREGHARTAAPVPVGGGARPDADDGVRGLRGRRGGRGARGRPAPGARRAHRRHGPADVLRG